nr:uncharacterized protein LOC123276133 [Equus asinus]
MIPSERGTWGAWAWGPVGGERVPEEQACAPRGARQVAGQLCGAGSEGVSSCASGVRGTGGVCRARGQPGHAVPGSRALKRHPWSWLLGRTDAKSIRTLVSRRSEECRSPSFRGYVPLGFSRSLSWP